MNIVKVTWLDTLIMACWTSLKDVKPLEVISLGWLAYEDDTIVCLTGLVEPKCSDQGNAVQVIPKGCIIRMEVVNDCSCTVTKEGRDT